MVKYIKVKDGDVIQRGKLKFIRIVFGEKLKGKKEIFLIK